MNVGRKFALVLGLVLASSACHAQQTVFIVRHAEKGDDSGDAALSAKGKARAEALARMLVDARVTAIYTSNFRRTVGTAEPLAARLNLEIKQEFQGDTDRFARLLGERHPDGVILVVGHSNTVPGLLKSFGHSPSPPIQISEAEFDNLFVLIPIKNALPQVVRLRY